MPEKKKIPELVKIIIVIFPGKLPLTGPDAVCEAVDEPLEEEHHEHGEGEIEHAIRELLDVNTPPFPPVCKSTNRASSSLADPDTSSPWGLRLCD